MISSVPSAVDPANTSSHPFGRVWEIAGGRFILWYGCQRPATMLRQSFQKKIYATFRDPLFKLRNTF